MKAKTSLHRVQAIHSPNAILLDIRYVCPYFLLLLVFLCARQRGAAMRVSVWQMRSKGQLRTSSTHRSAPPHVGNFSFSEIRDHESGRSFMRARLTGSGGTNVDLLPELLDARLLLAENNEMRIVGIERHGKTEYAQTWALEVLSC